MKVKICKGVAGGEIKAPPSKSYAHRLLICAALTGEKCAVTDVSESEDMGATLDCISSLGIKYERYGDRIIFHKSNEISADGKEFFCRESGSTLRFFIPILLALGGKMKLYGEGRLLERGLSVYEDICRGQEIVLEYDDRYLALEGKLKSGEFNIKGNISSQFVSGLMLALPMLEGDSVIRITTELESRPYVDITMDVLKEYGIEIIEKEKNTFYIKGNQKYLPKDAYAEGDYSNSAFLDAFNILGGDVSVFGLAPQSRQGDKAYIPMFKELNDGCPTLDITSCPDLGPILFALAAVKNGAYINGTARLRIKESDRCQAMAEELKKLGGVVEIFENSVKIAPIKELTTPKTELYGHNDHRIVMALAVISTLFGAEINGCEAVNKSYPDFFNAISSLGIEVKYEKAYKEQ